MVDFVEICNVCARKAIIEAAKSIINSDKVCHSYSDLNFGVTFLEHSVYYTECSIFFLCQSLTSLGTETRSASCDPIILRSFNIHNAQIFNFKIMCSLVTV